MLQFSESTIATTTIKGPLSIRLGQLHGVSYFPPFNWIL